MSWAEGSVFMVYKSTNLSSVYVCNTFNQGCPNMICCFNCLESVATIFIPLRWAVNAALSRLKQLESLQYWYHFIYSTTHFARHVQEKLIAREPKWLLKYCQFAACGASIREWLLELTIWVIRWRITAKKKETLIIERANDKEFLPIARHLSKLSPKECRCALITFDWHLTIGLQRAALISSDDVHCRNVMILLKDG